MKIYIIIRKTIPLNIMQYTFKMCHFFVKAYRNYTPTLKLIKDTTMLHFELNFLIPYHLV